MKNLIIYAHPDKEKSHCSKVLNFLISQISEKKEDYQLIDLYSDKFNPCLEMPDLRSKNPIDSLAISYQNSIKSSEKIFFIYPIWWYTYPAIVKGFFDKVFTPGFAYKFRKMAPWMEFCCNAFPWFFSISFLYPIFNAFIPADRFLKGKKAIMINTYGGNEAACRVYGCAPKKVADQVVLDFSGISVKRIDWFEARKEGEDIPQKIKDKILSSLSW